VAGHRNPGDLAGLQQRRCGDAAQRLYLEQLRIRRRIRIVAQRRQIDDAVQFAGFTDRHREAGRVSRRGATGPVTLRGQAFLQPGCQLRGVARLLSEHQPVSMAVRLRCPLRHGGGAAGKEQVSAGGRITVVHVQAWMHQPDGSQLLPPEFCRLNRRQ
jgi:hypothetical protein